MSRVSCNFLGLAHIVFKLSKITISRSSEERCVECPPKMPSIVHIINSTSSSRTALFILNPSTSPYAVQFCSNLTTPSPLHQPALFTLTTLPPVQTRSLRASGGPFACGGGVFLAPPAKVQPHVEAITVFRTSEFRHGGS